MNLDLICRRARMIEIIWNQVSCRKLLRLSSIEMLPEFVKIHSLVL